MDKYNSLGFNKHTEALLRGSGGSDLIKEFKRKDISTDVLHKLTKEDFIRLGNIFTLIIMSMFYVDVLLFIEI